MDLLDTYLSPFGQLLEPAVTCSLREISPEYVPVPCGSPAVWDVILSCPGGGLRVAYVCDDHAAVAAANGVRCGEHDNRHNSTVATRWRRGGAA
jgi:hypothetical protein